MTTKLFEVKPGDKNGVAFCFFFLAEFTSYGRRMSYINSAMWEGLGEIKVMEPTNTRKHSFIHSFKTYSIEYYNADCVVDRR